MNALLEGDVARVGVVGIGAAARAAPGAQAHARRRRWSSPRPRAAHRARLPRRDPRPRPTRRSTPCWTTCRRRGCTALAVSGAFSVDAPEQEDRVVERARARGLPVCAGHELTGTYGLEVRTVVGRGQRLDPAGRRADGERRRARAARGRHRRPAARPARRRRRDVARRLPRRAVATIGSGPAAGVAAALHQLALTDGIVLECGGTSSNVTVVKGGRTVLRDLRVMGRPTVDPLGRLAGSSAPPAARWRGSGAAASRRSARAARTSPACPTPASPTRRARRRRGRRRSRRATGDPEAYAVVRAPDGRTWALTATCAAQRARRRRAATSTGRTARAEAARLAFDAARRAAAAQRRRGRARRCSTARCDKIAEAVAEAARAHGFGPDVPVVALGGAGTVLAPRVARAPRAAAAAPGAPRGPVLDRRRAVARARRDRPPRLRPGRDRRARARRPSARASTPGPRRMTVAVQTAFEPRDGLLRAVATGAVALESGAAGARAARRGRPARRRRHGARAPRPGALRLVAATGYYRVFSDDGDSRVDGRRRPRGGARSPSARGAS